MPRPEVERGSPPVGASDRVREEWRRRGRSEYVSGALAHHFTFWLIQLGASHDLINAGLDVVEDELRHAEMCAALVELAGGRDGPPLIQRERLALPSEPDAPLELRALRSCIGSFCLDETMAVTLFVEMRGRASVRQVRETADAFLSDEVSHRELGWVTLEWLLHEGGDARRERAAAEFARALEQRAPVFLNVDAQASALQPGADERAWGCMPAAVYVEVFRRTLVREIAPRLTRLRVPLAQERVDAIERLADRALGAGGDAWRSATR